MSDTDEIHHGITEIFRDLFLRNDLTLTPSTTAQDVPEWDSFKHIEIIIAVEERWSIKFSTRELDRLRSVGDLVSTIKAKLS